jgi:hypothetical protein
MPRYVTRLDLELDKNIGKNRVEYSINENKKIIIKNNEISITAESFDEARAYLDSFRAIVNYIKFKKLPIKNLTDLDLINAFYLPPYKGIKELKSGNIQGTKFCHFYHKIIINKKMQLEIRDIITFANEYQSKNVDINYYYWILKWFTFCLDEISINPLNMNIIARDETLFLKFWTFLEVISIKYIRNYKKYIENPKVRKNHLYESEVKEFINKLIKVNLEDIYNLRNEIIHQGKIHNPIIRKKLSKLINSCYLSIQEIIKIGNKEKIFDEEKFIEFRNKELGIIKM